jgi:ribosome production factor 1
MRKGLPAVTAADGRIPGGARGDGEGDDVEVDVGEDDEMDEDEAMKEIGKTTKGKQPTREELGIPALDEEQEYEWKWKPKMEVSRRTFFL